MGSGLGVVVPGPDIWAIPVLVAVLLAAAVADAKTGKVWNVVTYPAIVAGLLVSTSVDGMDGLTRSLAGFAAGFGPLLVCWVAGGVGGGDVKLMGAVGALTHWQFAVASLLCGLVFAVLMALVVMVRKRIVLRTLKRIGRALYLALIPGVKGGGPSDVDSPKIPFGVALSLGAGVVLVDSFLGGSLTRTLLGG